MSNIIKIIEAKLSDKSELGEWYAKRLAVCAGCEFNSENKENKTVRDKIIVVANLGKPTCLACACEIEAKASVETEDCGMVKLNRTSKWEKLSIDEETGFILTNNSENIGTVEYIGKNQYVINYISSDFRFDSNMNLTVSKKDLKIKKITTKTSCGCTLSAAKVNKKGDIEVKISYDTTRKGVINKNITITIEDQNDKVTKLFFNIKGKVNEL